MKLKAMKGDGETVNAGDKVVDFRGEEWTFVRATRANGEGRDGKVLVTRGASEREYYAGVFELEVTSW